MARHTDQIGVRLPRELYEKVVRLAEQEKRSVSAWVRIQLEKILEAK